ncbi:hypothetical protein DPMN_026436 [Dreissena polymorpha]|uniref:Uncharacterized protein n=1 Tax=Dreissena polymorpha TaxID=45954 RepID=A0A9D4REA6_DREPO|nr:hypothetical protein DPMN_026436 [Dreissena polymorpha]
MRKRIIEEYNLAEEYTVWNTLDDLLQETLCPTIGLRDHEEHLHKNIPRTMFQWSNAALSDVTAPHAKPQHANRVSILSSSCRQTQNGPTSTDVDVKSVCRLPVQFAHSDAKPFLAIFSRVLT